MSSTILKTLDTENRKKAPLTSFAVGDSIKVPVKIKEGDKERVQAFSGTVIARKGSRRHRNFYHSPHFVRRGRGAYLSGAFPQYCRHRSGDHREETACQTVFYVAGAIRQDGPMATEQA